MIFRILILFIFFSGTCIAQEITTLSIKETYALPDDTNKVSSLLSLSTHYYDISNDSSLIIANKSLEISEKINYKRGIAESLFRIGNNYYFLNRQQKAIHFFNQSIEKSTPINAQYWIARSYRQIASINIANKKYSEALHLNKKALSIHASMSDSSNVSQCYNRIGFLHLKKNNLDSAFIYVQKAIDMNIKTNDLRALAISYRNLANLYLINKDLATAELYYQKTLTLQKKHSKTHEIISTDFKYAQLLIQQERYQDAILHLNKGIKMAESINLLKNLPAFYQNLSLAKELSGNYKEAIKDYEYFINLNDSLQFKEEQLLLKRKNDELELLKLNKITLNLEQDKESKFISNNQRKTLTIILIIILVILILLIINTTQKQDLLHQISKKGKELTDGLITKDIRSEQFKAINEITQNHEITKEKIARELHDGLGGTLAAIKMNLMQLKKNKVLTDIIEDVGEIATTTRFISHDLHPPLLTNENYCNIIQDYLQHIFNNTNTKIAITLLPEKKINTLNLDIQLTAYRAIQELCTNIKNHAKASSVNFQLLAHSNEINLIIEDNGVGFTQSNATLKTNKGITLIKERLKIIDGELEIDSQIGKGTTIYVFIPINIKPE